jgi:hypothetical protein
MSVDILMYRAQPLTDEELRQIKNANVSDVDEIGGWEIRTYSFEEMSKNPERFDQIKDYMRTVDLMRTTTDYKACCIAHGMPDDTINYSFCHHYGGGITVSFNGRYLKLTADDLDKFTTTEKKTYCVVKRKCVDMDVDGWIARALLNVLENAVKNDQDIDLSYSPVCLNDKNCEMLVKALVELYDKDELYPNANLAQFMIEVMRAMHKADGDVFIEFQT